MRDLIWHLLMLAFWGTGFMSGFLWEKNRVRKLIDRFINGYISKDIGRKISDEKRKGIVWFLVFFRKTYWGKFNDKEVDSLLDSREPK